jgi:ABC-type antimicrobial peptide transport system permease subunit
LFGALALLLACAGLYGVLSYSVSRRTQEIGIRMALGAQRRDVLRMVLRQGMVLAMIGIVAGLASAFVLTRYVESLSTLLFGVKATDPLTYLVTVVLMIVVGLLACALPARKATKVDPLVALRYD